MPQHAAGPAPEERAPDAPGKPRPRRRWRRRLGVTGLVVVALVALESSPGVFGHDQAALSVQLVASDAAAAVSKVDPFRHDRSADVCSDLRSTFGVGNNLFKNRQFGFYASIWPSYQALSAFSVTSLRSHDSTCSADFGQALTAIDDNYWDTSVPGSPAAFDQGPNPFHFRSDLPRVDDSLWMGLAMMQQYSDRPAPALLTRAEAVFHLAVANWAGPGGGVYWEATGANNRSRAVVSNAPAAILGVELFRQTGDPRYLGWSKRIVGWLERTLRDPASGLYDDNVTDHGGRADLAPAKFTYTQGVMVGALGMLSTVDPARYPRSDAVELADRSMAYFDAHRSYGQPGFDLIWAESLLWAAGLEQDPAFTARARGALARVVATEPSRGDDLLTASSVTGLRALADLDPARYDQLLYVLSAGRAGRPARRGQSPGSSTSGSASRTGSTTAGSRTRASRASPASQTLAFMAATIWPPRSQKAMNSREPGSPRMTTLSNSGAQPRYSIPRSY